MALPTHQVFSDNLGSGFQVQVSHELHETTELTIVTQQLIAFLKVQK
jgi:hypothetical protein